MGKEMKENEILVNSIQKKLIPMFAWFHEFCVNNGLRYYALGGTMLGAVRHKGFIPWDDDIDVGMPRKDYDKFLKLCKGKKINNYEVECNEKDSTDFFYGYAKIYDTTTTLIEHSRYNIKRGIFIDLFPLDGAGNEKKEALKLHKPVYWRYQLLMAKTCAFNRNRAWYKNAAVLLCRFIPGPNNNRLLSQIDKLCKKYKFDDCKYVANMLGNWGEREIVEKRVMGMPRLYQFENIQIFGVENYDVYLTKLYGNWRDLPPKEKQITHHDYVYLNLNQSFYEK